MSRIYIPRIVMGKVKGTGLPIDGCTMYLSQWEYEDYRYFHLYGWPDEDDPAVMQSMYIAEMEAGICEYDTLEGFAAAWETWEPVLTFCLTSEQVDVVEELEAGGWKRQVSHAGRRGGGYSRCGGTTG